MCLHSVRLSEGTVLATLAQPSSPLVLWSWVCVVMKFSLHSSPPQILAAYSTLVIKIRLHGFKSQLSTYPTLGKYLISVNRAYGGV